MGKPTVKINCPANRHAGPTERIIEFDSGSRTDPQGGLISLVRLEDGSLRVEVYNTDAKVVVIGGTKAPIADNG